MTKKHIQSCLWMSALAIHTHGQRVQERCMCWDMACGMCLESRYLLMLWCAVYGSLEGGGSFCGRGHSFAHWNTSRNSCYNAVQLYYYDTIKLKHLEDQILL